MIIHLYKYIKENNVILMSICLLLGIMVPAFFLPNHFLANLEPYPDGLLYNLAARNLVREGDLSLIYGNAKLPFWMPPAYSFVLSVGYLFIQTPTAFYLSNLLLACVNTIFMYKIVQKIVGDKKKSFLLLILFTLQATYLYIMQLPLSENLALTLFITALAYFYRDNRNAMATFYFLCCAFGLALTRYAATPLTVIFIGYWLIEQVNQHLKFKRLVIYSIGFSIISVCILYANNILLHQVMSDFFWDMFFSSKYYSFGFIPQNIHFYLQTLVGFPHTLVWYKQPLVSFFVALPALAFLCYSLMARPLPKNSSKYRFIMGLIMAQLALPLIFYHQDTRYVYFTLPLYIVLIGYASTHYNKSAHSYLFILCILIASTVTQIKPLAQIIKSNYVPTRIGWQRMAISEFDRVYERSAARPQLITALPPFLISAYQTGSYTVLPLSEHQEFIAKGQQAWGGGVPLTELRREYAAWLKQGKKLYISNAYITHQQSVIDDFEAYKSMFTLRQVSEGCYSACNIYELQLRTQ